MIEPGNAWLAAALKAGAEEDLPRADCPLPERIWSAVRLELPLAERIEVIDHVMECPACAEEWRMIAETARHQPSLAATAGGGWTWIPRPVVWVPSASAILLIIGIGIGAMLPRAPQPPPGPRELVRGVVPREVLPAVPRDDFWIRWAGGQPGTRYDLRVSEPGSLERAIVEKLGLDTPEYRVPPELLNRLPSGARVWWRVEAYSAELGRVSSPTYEVTIR